MAHFARTNPDATWNNGGAGSYITVQSDWLDLGTKARKAINGATGGAWAPSAQITFDTAGFLVTGPAVVDYNGIIQTTNGSRFILNVGDYPKLAPNHVGRTRTLQSDMQTFMCTPRYEFGDSPNYAGSIQSMACTILAPFQPGNILENPSTHIDLRVHDGARMIGGTLTFRIPTLRYQAPVMTPRIRIIRIDQSGNIQPLMAPSSTVDANGYFSITHPSSGTQWFANGQAQTFAFACDQNNLIDVSQYTYHFQIQEEVGTLDPTFSTSSADGAAVRVRKSDVVYTFTSIPYFTDSGGTAQLGPYGQPTGLPITINDGDTVFIDVAATGSYSDVLRAANGVWIVHYSGAWERVPDLQTPSDLTPYFLIFDKNLKRFVEYTGPFQPSGSLHLTFYGNAAPGQHITSLTTNPYLYSDVAMNFQTRQPRGNIYHSLAMNFDSIMDMRPQ